MFHEQHIRKKRIFVRFFSILRTGCLFLLLRLPGKNAKFMLKMIFEGDTSLILHPLLYWGPFIYYVITCRGEGVRKCQFLIICSTKKYAYVGGEGVQKS